METKPLHDNDGRLQCSNREKKKPCVNGNGQIWVRIEKQKMGYLGRVGNIKKVQNHKYHVSEESREKMDMERPKRCNEGRN